MSQAVLTSAQADKDVVVFKALANSVRLQIVSFVAASEEGQVSAGQIVERFDLSQPTISHHLRVLREAGVLTTYKTSTFVYYRFAPQLREAVASVLPVAPAAEPPQEPAPARRAPARSPAKRTSRTVKKAAAEAPVETDGAVNAAAEAATADVHADSPAPDDASGVVTYEAVSSADDKGDDKGKDKKSKKKKHKGKKKDKKK